MGMNIKIPDANFTKSLGAILPFNSNLVGYWNFSAGLTEGRKNQVTGSVASLIGSPSVVDGALNIDRTKGLLTNLVVNSNKTFITVMRYDGSNILVGSIDYTVSGTSGQDGIFTDGNTAAVQVNRGSGARTTSANYFTPDKPYIIAGTLDNVGSDVYVYDGTNTVTATKASTDAQTDIYPLRIGGWATSVNTFEGNAKIYTTLVYNRKLSASEINTVFEYLKSKSNLFAG
ncbi:hypothetical protein [Psychrobacter celer]|uniref:hypothetical protein n=1 Tax=Psychrobacter celer TaxID=306572 RepID=UPI002FE489CA